MDRASIEAIVRKAYEARVSGDLEAMVGCFADGGSFAVCGHPAASPVPTFASGRAAIRESISRLVETFEFREARIVDLLVDGNRAAVHVHAKVRAVPTGAERETDLLDILEIRDGKIHSMRQFADTALVVQMLGK